MEENFKMPETPKKEKRKGKLALFFIIILLIVAITTVVILIKSTINKNNPNNTPTSGNQQPQLFTRTATTNDFYIDIQYNFPLDIGFIVVSYVDIDMLSLNFVFADKNKKPISEKTKVIGNLKQGVPYQGKFNISEFSVSEIFKTNYTTCYVLDGSVSYFS